MNMDKFTCDNPPPSKEFFEYRSLKICNYHDGSSHPWQATASARVEIVPYGYGATADEAVLEMLREIDESIKKLNLLRQDALEALGEECKNKQEVQNG